MTKPRMKYIVSSIMAVLAMAATITGYAADPAVSVGKANGVSVKQFSQELAASMGKLSMPHQPMVDPLSPVQQQRMQQSLETYFRTLVSGMLAGEGGGGGSAEGVCLPGWPAMCRGDDDQIGGIEGNCMSNSQGWFGNCGEGSSVICQVRGGTATYKVTTECRWIKSK